MADQFINVRVNAEQAKKNLEEVSRSVIEQEKLIASLSVTLAKAESDLESFNFSGYRGQLRLEEQVKKTKLQIKEEAAALKIARADQKEANLVLRNSNKIRTAGTVKAIEFNETLLKNRDISAGLSKITGGLSYQIQSFGKLFVSVGKGIRGAAVAMSAFQKALLATGIGALVVAVGLLAANWDKIKNFITGSNPELKKLEERTDRLIISTKNEVTLLERQKELLKLQGKETDEINKLLIQKFELQKKNLLLLIDELEIQLQKETAQAKEVTTWEKLVNGVGSYLGLVDRSALAVEALSGQNEKTKELTDKIADSRSKILDLNISIAKINKEETVEEEKQLDLLDKQFQKEQQILMQRIESTISAESQIGQIRRDFFKRNLEDRQAEIEIERDEQVKRIQESEANEVAKRMALAEVNKYYDNLQKKREEKASKDAIKIQQIEQQQKLAVIGSTLATASTILGKNTKAGKAAGVASALVNTYQGVTQVWKSESVLPEPFATIQRIASTATVLASGLAAVRQIKSVDTSGSGGAAGGGIRASAPSIQSAAPSFNIVGADSSNQLAQTISAQTNKPIQTYVVAGDVTTAQGLERNIIQESSLG